MLSKKVKKKSARPMVSMRLLTIILLTAVAVFFTVADSALAKGWKKNKEILEEVNVFIEWNSEDTDHGIQFFWDSDGFTRMMVFNESGKKALDIKTNNNVKAQGLTETAIESVEPEEEEQSREEFFERFPEGWYHFWGRSIEGGWLYGKAYFSHDLLEPAELNLDDFFPDGEISWTEPQLNDVTGEPLEAVGIEIVVELVVDDDGDERVFKETTTLPAGTTEYVVSETFMDLIDNPPGDIEELKVEILYEEPSGNKTISETEVELEED
jgi:hypothetical protein